MILFLTKHPNLKKIRAGRGGAGGGGGGGEGGGLS